MSTIKVDTIATRTGSGTITVSNNASFTGDATFDTSTLKVDAANNRVGIGTASPSSNLHVSGGAGAHVAIQSSAGSHWRLGDAVGSSNGIFVVRDHTNSANRIQILADGKTQIAQGVTFGSDTAAANTLDDYEEGTFTPFFTTANNNLTLNGNASTTSSMYTTQGGSYIKIGRKVICHMSIATNGVTSHGGSGNLWIGGLPFTTATTTAGEPRGVNGAMAGRFSSFTPDQLVCNSNATTLQIRAGFESYPTRSNLDTGGSSNRNVIEALIVYSVA